ncbi:general stress protein [Quadrisphaera sp. GCM10027208]|uniref:general stress protein n=1 Tax=Quadrisphaera sp. GCM10027208 TaxID=3273423 RepID=UPI0036124903
MSNVNPMGRSPLAVPTPPKGVEIADYPTYLEAQKAVDYLSDHQFPVQLVTIVGVDLKMVERVTGRLSYPRVALAGAASGAWFGLFVGLLLSLFSPGTTLFETVLPALLIGAGFGMLFGVISYSFTGGRRDFTSTSQIVAGRYSVLCAEEEAGRARQMLADLAQGRPAGTHDTP